MNQYVDRADLADVRSWIKVVEAGGELTTIKIIHEGTRDPVKEYTRAKGDFPADPESVAGDDFLEAIAKKIEGDASGFDGSTEQYYVEAYYGGAHRHSDRIPIRCSIEKDSKENRRGRTEKPTEEGVLSLMMRLTDSATTKTTKALENLVTSLYRMVEQGLAREATMRDELSKVRDAMDALSGSIKDSERKDREAEADRKMNEELLADAKVLLKIMANKAYGGTLIPEGELSPEQRLIRQAVKELEGGQIEMLMELFQDKHPRIAQMIGELVSTVQDEDARRAGIAQMLAERKAKALDAAKETKTALVPTNGASKVNGSTIGPLRGEPLQR